MSTSCCTYDASRSYNRALRDERLARGRCRGADRPVLRSHRGHREVPERASVRENRGEVREERRARGARDARGEHDGAGPDLVTRERPEPGTQMRKRRKVFQDNMLTSKNVCDKD